MLIKMMFFMLYSGLSGYISYIALYCATGSRTFERIHNKYMIKLIVE